MCVDVGGGKSYDLRSVEGGELLSAQALLPQALRVDFDEMTDFKCPISSSRGRRIEPHPRASWRNTFRKFGPRQEAVHCSPSSALCGQWGAGGRSGRPRQCGAAYGAGTCAAVNGASVAARGLTRSRSVRGGKSF